MINSLTQRVGTSRTWAIGLGVGLAVLAGILLLAYLNSYRNSIAGENADTPVLVAKSLIPKGTPGTDIARKELYQGSSVRAKEVKLGAITDPAVMRGTVAAADILPGQQLTAADFVPETTAAINTHIKGAERAISIGIDNIHGSLPQVAPGDYVDIYLAAGAANGQSIVKLFRSNVRVLTVPAVGGTLILKVDQSDVADFMYAADNTQFYFALRPQFEAKPTRPDTANIQTVLRGGR